MSFPLLGLFNKICQIVNILLIIKNEHLVFTNQGNLWVQEYVRVCNVAIKTKIVFCYVFIGFIVNYHVLLMFVCSLKYNV